MGMRGFSLLLEVSISLIVIFSLLFFFHSGMYIKEEYVSKLEEIGKNALSILDEREILEERIYGEEYSLLNDDLNSTLPISVKYNFFVYNSTDLVGNRINDEPYGVTTNVVYFLYGNESYYDPRKIELILWYKE
jgi:hypothetical protein